MARILVTGSADGLGFATAQTLLTEGHTVVVHARDSRRARALDPLTAQGAQTLIADFADRDEVLAAAAQLNAADPLDGVVHNAGVYRGAAVMPVNVVAPYLLTALLPGVRRHVYVSSGMHRGGTASVEGIDWGGARSTGTYSDSKLFVATLSAAVARRRPEVRSNAVDPGWVPTKMGGAGAPDDLRLGHLTQERLVTGAEGEVSGGYWFHGRQQRPHPAVLDERFQEQLLRALAEATGVELSAG